jgi:deoxyribodipyrimidine photolyase
MTPTTETDQDLGILALAQESRNAVLDKLEDFSGIPTVIIHFRHTLNALRVVSNSALFAFLAAGEISLVREMATTPAALRNLSSTEPHDALLVCCDWIPFIIEVRNLPIKMPP